MRQSLPTRYHLSPIIAGKTYLRNSAAGTIKLVQDPAILCDDFLRALIRPILLRGVQPPHMLPWLAFLNVGLANQRPAERLLLSTSHSGKSGELYVGAKSFVSWYQIVL